MHFLYRIFTHARQICFAYNFFGAFFKNFLNGFEISRKVCVFDTFFIFFQFSAGLLYHEFNTISWRNKIHLFLGVNEWTKTRSRKRSLFMKKNYKIIFSWLVVFWGILFCTARKVWMSVRTVDKSSFLKIWSNAADRALRPQTFLWMVTSNTLSLYRGTTPLR
jgi:hypothetical protein